MKILITGACGHIGSFLVENLNKIKKIKKTILIDSMKTNKYNSLFKLKKKPNFNFYQRDLSIKNSLSDFKNVDIIIHCASITDAASSFGIKKLMYKNNIGCMKTVLDPHHLRALHRIFLLLDLLHPSVLLLSPLYSLRRT